MARLSVTGRVALVTGAARGIGFETARLLRERGASVVLVDLREDEVRAAAARLGDRALAVAADVCDRAALEGAVTAATDRFGGLDVCVANAGLAPPAATIRTMDPEVFERVVEVDLLGVHRTVSAALPQLVERRGHAVVVASFYAFMNGALQAPYAMAKAGVEAYGRALRAELSAHGASATVAYFGFIDTAMVRAAFEDDLVRESTERLLPRPALRQLPPAAAGAAIVRGIERRSPRVVAPAGWAVVSALRGLVGPAGDALMPRSRSFRQILAAADLPARAAEGVPAGDPAADR